MNLVDTHIHLNFNEFHPDLEAVVERMQKGGLVAAINIGVDAASSEASVALAERFPWLSAAVGIHPHSANKLEAQLDTIKRLSRHPKVVAIGEVGLDYYRNEVAAADQVAAFKAQLDLALSVEKPVILHCRDSYPLVQFGSYTTDYLPLKIQAVGWGGLGR